LGRADSTHGEDENVIIPVPGNLNPNGNAHLEGIGVDGRITLKRISDKEDMIE
jgi:hypothetical protein